MTDLQLDSRLRNAGEHWRTDDRTVAAATPQAVELLTLSEALEDIAYPRSTPVRPGSRWRFAGIAAVAIAGVAIAAVLTAILRDGSHATRGVAPGSTASTTSPHTDATPAIVRESAIDAIGSETVKRLDQPIEWVQTTAERLPNPQGIAAGVEVYVIQIHGDFVCRSCKGAFTTPPTGTAIILEFAVHTGSGIYAFNLTNQPWDLTPAGAVGTFTITYPSPTNT